ncbi:MAG: DUF4136 domain-containing protein [Pseudomonadales bacterium]|nr:DUF4136 domain-containing protein [Pseudomonadales bacterium]
MQFHSINRWMMLGLITLLSGCTSSAVVDYDRSVQFERYKTFAFISDHPMILGSTSFPVSPLLEGRLTQAIQTSLQSRGLVFSTDRETADVAVSFTVGSREKISVDSYPSAYQGYYGRYDWGAGYYYGNDVSVRQYTQGLLAIDLFDVKARQPVWHAKASQQITSKMQKKPESFIQKIVDSMLSKFPPN